MPKQNLNEIRKDVDDLREWRKEVNDKMGKFNDFMIVQQDRQSRVKDDKGNINWLELGKQALVFLTVCASVVLIMVQFILERSK